MEPARQRISDQERQQVAEVLREAAARGGINVDGLDERLAVTVAAKAYAELVPSSRSVSSPCIVTRVNG